MVHRALDPSCLPRLLSWSSLSVPSTVWHRLCPRPVLCPRRSHLLPPGPHVSIRRPAARPPQARCGAAPSAPRQAVLHPCDGCCPTRLSGRTWGVLREAASLSLQRRVNAKTCRFILPSLRRPSPLCRRRHLGSRFHCFRVVAGSLLACLPPCSGSTRLPKLPPE